MKALTRIFSTIHALMALLFACAALRLVVIAATQAWGCGCRPEPKSSTTTVRLNVEPVQLIRRVGRFARCGFGLQGA